MAAGLGYIEFATGDILTAAAANGYLASQTVMVFANAAARTSAITSPQEGMFSYLKDTNATEYYSGSAWVAIGGAGGGKVLQVVNATYSTAVTSSSSTYSDTGLTASITPSSATSKILVIVHQTGVQKASGDTYVFLRLVRGSTSLAEFEKAAGYNASTNAITVGGSGITFLDSPATTSSTTYKTQFASGANIASARVQNDNSTSTITLMEIGA